MMAGLISVPLYPLQSADSIAYVLEHAQCKVILLGKLDDAEKLEAGIGPQLTRIALPYPTLACTHEWHSLLAAHEPLQTLAVQQPGQVLTLVYTSGTTGNPKGVMLSVHAMAFTAANACREMGMSTQDRFFSFLPLSHVAERFMVEFNSLYCGAPVAFVESMETFSRDLCHVRPTVFFAVPRLWTRFQLGVLEKLPQAKLARLLRIPLIGALVARKVRRGLGLDQARIMISGAAAISRGLLDWYQAIGLTLCEGYGMSENVAYGCFNRPGQVRFGTVGRPMKGLEVRIADSGEILFRSPTLMLGYYLEPEKNCRGVGRWLAAHR